MLKGLGAGQEGSPIPDSSPSAPSRQLAPLEAIHGEDQAGRPLRIGFVFVSNPGSGEAPLSEKTPLFRLSGPPS